MTCAARVAGTSVRSVLGGGIVALAGLCATPAHAADEEIQVYMNEFNDPHQLGLDVHVNYVPSGDRTPDYTGAEIGVHRLRVTPEFAYALDRHFELGAYLPLTTLDHTGTFRVEGAKLRLKWMGSHTSHGFFYGLNYELGRVDHKLDQNPWNNEIKLIGGWEGDKWIIAANTNIDFAVSGPAKGPADIELATKVGYKLTRATTIGFESYNGIGTVRNFGAVSASDQASYLVVDTRIGAWDLNAGVGKGYGTNKDDVIVKFVIGVPMGR